MIHRRFLGERFPDYPCVWDADGRPPFPICRPPEGTRPQSPHLMISPLIDGLKIEWCFYGSTLERQECATAWRPLGTSPAHAAQSGAVCLQSAGARHLSLSLGAAAFNFLISCVPFMYPLRILYLLPVLLLPLNKANNFRFVVPSFDCRFEDVCYKTTVAPK
ncbi:hypothetical protein NDU88_001318 [Pleurodeles waltl]|uniref:Uncharacterized protein n=1 Tax=Pleurodeles waltl TaxID=8319 RepID=A0AAV7SAL6_PLEWA|nr:hypothetical protein NDU88_001318 [Pleurodeles waltl]